MHQCTYIRPRIYDWLGMAAIPKSALISLSSISPGRLLTRIVLRSCLSGIFIHLFPYTNSLAHINWALDSWLGLLAFLATMYNVLEPKNFSQIANFVGQIMGVDPWAWYKFSMFLRFRSLVSKQWATADTSRCCLKKSVLPANSIEIFIISRCNARDQCKLKRIVGLARRYSYRYSKPQLVIASVSSKIQYSADIIILQVNWSELFMWSNAKSG